MKGLFFLLLLLILILLLSLPLLRLPLLLVLFIVVVALAVAVAVATCADKKETMAPVNENNFSGDTLYTFARTMVSESKSLGLWKCINDYTFVPAKGGCSRTLVQRCLDFQCLCCQSETLRQYVESGGSSLYLTFNNSFFAANIFVQLRVYEPVLGLKLPGCER